MVRRRSKGKQHKRKYDSDLESESSEEEFDPNPASPVAPRRYGLRERKRPLLLIDPDDEDEFEKGASEEDEYNVQVDLKQSQIIRQPWSPVRIRGRLKESPSLSSTSTATDNNLCLGDGLIDFEDVIRADVVVNQKGPIVESQITNPSSEDGNDRLEVQLDPLDFVRTECEEDMQKNGIVESVETGKHFKQNGSKVTMGLSVTDEIEKFEPPKLDEKEAEVILSNDYLLGNNFELSAEEFLVKQSEPVVEPPEEEVPQINFDSDSDDSVVLIETKHEVIVLDD